MKRIGFTASVLCGALGMAAVSTLSFAIWAWPGAYLSRLGGDALLYSCIALAFMVCSGLVLASLAGGGRAFHARFIPAFLAYCLLWCLCWFGLGGRPGEWLGGLLGALALTRLIAGAMKPAQLLALGLLAGLWHNAGYFAGSWAMFDWLMPLAKSALAAGENERARQLAILAKLLWGTFYGLGLGAVLGLAFWRRRIAA
jgi:hypothetical protein